MGKQNPRRSTTTTNAKPKRRTRRGGVKAPNARARKARRLCRAMEQYMGAHAEAFPVTGNPPMLANAKRLQASGTAGNDDILAALTAATQGEARDSA